MSSGDTRNRIVFATTSMSEMEAWVVGIQTCIYNSTRPNGTFKENGTTMNSAAYGEFIFIGPYTDRRPVQIRFRCILLIYPHIQHFLSLDSIDTDQIERRINYVGQQGAVTHARDTYYSKSENLPNTFTKGTTARLGSSENKRHIQRNSRYSFEDSEKGKLHLR